MNIQKLCGHCIVFLLVLITVIACSNNESNEKSEDLTGYKIEYEVLGENAYKVNEQEYLFQKRVSGRSENAMYDSYYIVLSNNSDLTFEEIDERFWGSNLSLDEEFIIVEYGLINN